MYHIRFYQVHLATVKIKLTIIVMVWHKYKMSYYIIIPIFLYICYTCIYIYICCIFSTIGYFIFFNKTQLCTFFLLKSLCAFYVFTILRIVFVYRMYLILWLILEDGANNSAINILCWIVLTDIVLSLSFVSCNDTIFL